MKSIMRNLSLAICGFVFLMSCSPDDEAINPLLGTWTLKALTTSNCKDQSQNITINYVCDNVDCNKYMFNADGTLKVEQRANGSTTTTEGMYTISNQTEITNIKEPPSNVRAFAYNVSGSTLYLIEIFPPLSGKCSTTTVLSR